MTNEIIKCLISFKKLKDHLYILIYDKNDALLIIKLTSKVITSHSKQMNEFQDCKPNTGTIQLYKSVMDSANIRK